MAYLLRDEFMKLKQASGVLVDQANTFLEWFQMGH